MSDIYQFMNCLRDLTRPRKLVAPILLIGLAALLAFLSRYNSPTGEYVAADVYNNLYYNLILRFILVILSVVFVTGVIAQETEQKTISYLLTRPVPRWRILLPKFIASALMTMLTVYLASFAVALIAFGPAGLGKSPLGRDLLIVPIGVLAHGALFLLAATLLYRPLIIGLIYAFLEGVLSYLPGDWSKISLMSYVIALSPHLNVAAADAINTDSGPISMPVAWTVLLSVIGVCLLAALMVFSVREYVPREDTA